MHFLCGHCQLMMVSEIPTPSRRYTIFGKSPICFLVHKCAATGVRAVGGCATSGKRGENFRIDLHAYPAENTLKRI